MISPLPQLDDDVDDFPLVVCELNKAQATKAKGFALAFAGVGEGEGEVLAHLVVQPVHKNVEAVI